MKTAIIRKFGVLAVMAGIGFNAAGFSICAVGDSITQGGTAFTAGVVLKTIGKKRLNWVEDQANAARGYSLNVGATPNGMGLYLTF